MKLSVLIPFYNEEEQVKITLDTVRPIIKSITEDYEIIAIDDGSKDKTWEIIEAEGKSDSGIYGIRFSRNFGKESAICAGLESASGDAVVLMDGDLQHPPHYIPEMVRLWQNEGYHVIEGVKTSRGKEGKLNRFFAKAFYKGFNKISGVDLDNASDFKLLDRTVVDAWNELNEHNTFFRSLSAWLGFKRYELPFEVADRQHGETKWSIKSLWRLAVNAITSFSTAPLVLVTYMGILFLIIASVIAVITLVKFFTHNALEGFTTVILLILITGGAIMLSLGLIGTYIGKIYDEVKGRPRFIKMEEINSPDSNLEAQVNSAQKLNK